MLLLRGATRALSTSVGLSASGSAPAGDKSKLAKLRKLTGYSFVHCKRALQQHNYDVEAAEKWLRQQAQAEGWAKANKLGARATPQGLVCVATMGRSAAMVELCCETDFVARNSVFDQLARGAAVSCLPAADRAADDSINTVRLADVEGLPDRVALSIGQLGENISLGRAAAARAGATTHLATYVHPDNGEKGGVHAGRYAALVLFEMFDSGKNVLPPPKFGRNLCQHIVGMAPLTLGDPAAPVLAKDDAQQAANPPKEGEAPDSDDESGGKKSREAEEQVETRLLDQEFLVDPDLTVREFLAENNARVINFVRMECGEAAGSAD